MGRVCCRTLSRNAVAVLSSETSWLEERLGGEEGYYDFIAANHATLALWYYWRWKIESYFKLLKSAGQQLEHWQQENAETFTDILVTLEGTERISNIEQGMSNDEVRPNTDQHE